MVFVLLAAHIVYAGNYQVKRKVGEYNVVINIDRNPPIAGDNNVSIEVSDASGRCACNADVIIEYSRPAMPGIPALHYTADTRLKKGRYIGKISLSLPGSWNIAVKIVKGEKKWTTNFTVDVE